MAAVLTSLRVGRYGRALGCRALRSAEPELAQDLQAIDGLVRRLFNLAAFLDEVGGGEPLPARSQLSASLERLKVR